MRSDVTKYWVGHSPRLGLEDKLDRTGMMLRVSLRNTLAQQVKGHDSGDTRTLLSFPSARSPLRRGAR